jgi:DNA modification methylase
MIYQGDCLTVLKTLPAESVQCVVTSPPYWGLRDYGTADWTGGRIDCQHREQRGGVDPATSGKQLTNQGTVQTQYARVCRDCGAERVDAQIGLEATPADYVASLVAVFTEVWRVLKPDGTLWLNLGDSYNAGRNGGSPGGKSSIQQVDDRYLKRSGANVPDLKPKDLVGIPWRVALALQSAGWTLRADIIWHKPNPMPESIRDRPTKSHEYLFLLTKSERYYYDADAIREPYAESTLLEVEEEYHGEGLKDYAAAGVQNPSDVKRRIIQKIRNRNARPDIDTRGGNQAGSSMPTVGSPIGRNKRSVWTIPTESFEEAHFATFPEALVEPCIRAGSRAAGPDTPADIVLDPFGGAGTVGVVAVKLQRRFILIDLNAEYVDMQRKRINGVAPLFFEIA